MRWKEFYPFILNTTPYVRINLFIFYLYIILQIKLFASFACPAIIFDTFTECGIVLDSSQ